MGRGRGSHHREGFIGVISDTHGLLRPEAVRRLDGAELIVHAGDVGAEEVLCGLEAIAPVHAVRGNVDRGVWAEELPLHRVVEVDGARIYVVHDLSDLEDPKIDGFDAVVFGHSHRPVIEDRDGVVFFNPGSAGPRRFHLPVCVGRLVIAAGRVDAQWIPLKV